MAKPVTTPKGTAIFPNLNKPDTKFDENGVYSVTLRLAEEDAAEFIDAIEAGMDEAEEVARKDNPKAKKIKRADPPYGPAYDKDGEEITGFVDIRFKSKATTRDGDPRKVIITDARGTRMNNPPLIRMGSTIRVAAHISPFYTGMVGAGVSLRIAGVKLLKLNEGINAEYLGFDEEEEGYVMDEAEAALSGDESSDPYQAPTEGSETDDFE